MSDKEKKVIVPEPKPEDIRKHGYVPTALPNVDLKPPEKPKTENDKSDNKNE